MIEGDRRPDERYRATVGGRKGDAALAAFLGLLDEELAWRTGAVFTGLTIKKQNKGYLMVLRANVNGAPKVAFFGDGTLIDCWRLLYSMTVLHKIDWKDDKYAR